MYNALIYAMTGFGLLCSAFFVLTWTPAAIKAKRHRIIKLPWRDVLDFAGLPVAIFVLYALSMVNVITLGVPPAPDWGVRAARVLTSLIFDSIVAIRAVRWAGKLANASGAPVEVVPTKGTFSDERNASEGSNDDQDLDPSQH